MGESLNPTLLSRVSRTLRPDFTRTLLARRIAAGGLVVLAGVAAFRPDPADADTDVVIAVRDLIPGVTLTAVADEGWTFSGWSANVVDGKIAITERIDSSFPGRSNCCWRWTWGRT